MAHNVKWRVSLSNGETLFEGKGDYEEFENLPSPWQRLQEHILDNDVEITSLSLYTDDGQTFNLPSLGRNPKFHAFQQAQKPLDFEMKRAISRELKVSGGQPQGKPKQIALFTVISAIYPDYVLELWVDEQNPKNCWVLVKDGKG